MPMKNPLRPGDFIRTETIEPAGLSLTAAALRVSRPLSSLLSGKADLSGAIALHIEEGFGVNETLLPDAKLLRTSRKREKQIHVHAFQVWFPLITAYQYFGVITLSVPPPYSGTVEGNTA